MSSNSATDAVQWKNPVYIFPCIQALLNDLSDMWYFTCVLFSYCLLPSSWWQYWPWIWPQIKLLQCPCSKATMSSASASGWGITHYTVIGLIWFQKLPTVHFSQLLLQLVLKHNKDTDWLVRFPSNMTIVTSQTLCSHSHILFYFFFILYDIILCNSHSFSHECKLNNHWKLSEQWLLEIKPWQLNMCPVNPSSSASLL